ncbi:MAG: helix-turn-helix domain-containing protein [Gemmatimonadota bacterium]
MPKRKALTREARAAETRDAIIATALRLFQRSGIEGTSLDAVAAELGLTKGAVYARFPSKAALVEAVASANTTPRGVFDALLEPGVPLTKRLAEFAKRLVSSRVSARVVLLDLEYVIYSARNATLAKADRSGFEEAIAAMAARFREVNEATGDEVPMGEEKFLLLLNIVSRGLLQQMALRPGSLGVEDVVGMVMQLGTGGGAKRGRRGLARE